MKVFITDPEHILSKIEPLLERASKNRFPLLSLLIRREGYDKAWRYMNNLTNHKAFIAGQSVWMTGGVRITLEKVEYV